MNPPIRPRLVPAIATLIVLAMPCGSAVADSAAGAWDTGFFLPGFDGPIEASLVFNGDLIVGGTFETVNGVVCNNIARWDGSSWQPLGAGLAVPVYSMAVHNGLLHVGQPMTYTLEVGVWDGTAWNSLPSVASILSFGAVNEIKAMTVYDGVLVMGGRFEAQLPDGTAKGLFAWDGAEYSRLGAFSGLPYALAVHDGRMVVGGGAVLVDEVNMNGVAAWDGFAWSALGTGVDFPTNLVSHGVHLYAFGAITSSSFPYTYSIERWDGAAWTTVQSGLSSGGTCGLSTGTDLYIASYDWIKRFDGVIWADLPGEQPDDHVRTLALYGGDLVAGGEFLSVGGVPAPRLARYDGASWSTVGVEQGWGLDGRVNDIVEYQGDIVAGGYFLQAGIDRIPYLAAWDGQSWRSLGTGPSGHVLALTVWNGMLVATGGFNQAGGVDARHIAAWDGAAWHALGDGLGSEALALEVYGGELIAGGWFSWTSTGTQLRYVGAWNGATWHELGGGWDPIPSQYDRVHSLGLWDGKLIVGGGFGEVRAGLPAHLVAAWDGAQWSALSNEILVAGQSVHSLSAFGPDLVIGGWFWLDGGRNHITSWNGIDFGPFDNGMDEGFVVETLEAGGRLYATGDFPSIGGVPQGRVAVWDAGSWLDLGSGLGEEGQGHAMWETPEGILVAGAFDRAGGTVSHNLARWVPQDPSAAPEPGTGTGVFSLGTARPNPFGSGTRVHLTMETGASVEAAVFDVRGRKVKTLHGGAYLAGGVHVLRWDGNTDEGGRAPAGVYFLRVNGGRDEVVRRFVRVK